eukprot:651942-Amorphochlora_amoeboformis.AAC.1
MSPRPGRGSHPLSRVFLISSAIFAVACVAFFTRVGFPAKNEVGKAVSNLNALRRTTPFAKPMVKHQRQAFPGGMSAMRTREKPRFRVRAHEFSEVANAVHQSKGGWGTPWF